MPVAPDFYVTSGYGPRDGGFHYGTDFGKRGGSGGQPVFAVKDGTVNMVGPASGFGQWVVLDHDAKVGGGTSVYGHIIPEVALGQFIREGQRVGYINPNSQTNGGVAPHLHYEFHRTVWAPPGGDRLDPMKTVLVGAAKHRSAPATSPAPKSGTIFGVDVSEHQDGISLKKAASEGIKFAIVRTTDGDYRDRCYRSHIEDAESAGLITAAYHYLRNPAEGSTVQQQVNASLAVMGNLKRPMWIDVETPAGLHVNHIRECKAAFERAGVRVIGVYSYVPYWEGMIAPGEPDSHEFGKFWVAAYGANNSGAPAKLYPGDANAQWDYPLGNQKPVLWQYGSNAGVAGFASVDINAYRGSKDQLRELFYGEGQNKKNNDTKDNGMNIASRIRSIINPKVEFDADTMLALVDATTWKNHVLLRELCRKSNIDPDKVVSDAINADRERK